MKKINLHIEQMLWILYLYTRQICLSSLNKATMLGYPVVQNVLIASDGTANFTSNRHYNLMENVCVCSNERTYNGVAQTASSNGVCEDVSNSTHAALYDFGTDCEDCGSRGNYPSYVCSTCSNYLNQYDLGVRKNAELLDGIYCETPRGNVLSFSIYEHMYLPERKVYSFGDSSELCKLYRVKNSTKVPFRLNVYQYDGDGIDNITVHAWQSAFSSSTAAPSTLSELNVTGVGESPEILISVSNSLRLTFQTYGDHEILHAYLYVSANRVIPFTNFRFELSYVVSELKDLESASLFDAYIPYSSMECLTTLVNEENLAMHVQINSDCTLQSEYSKLLIQQNNRVSLYPLILQAKFPKHWYYIPVVRHLNHSFIGVVDTHFHFLEESRVLLEFRIDADQYSLLQMYGLKLRYENITLVNNTYCRLSVESSYGNVLKLKDDMGAERKCVWVQDNKITEMFIDDHMISAIYAKVPAPLSMLGSMSKKIFLFGIEARVDESSDFSVYFEDDPVSLLVTSFPNRPSSMCSVQQDVLYTMSSLSCSPDISYTRESVMDNMAASMITKALVFDEENPPTFHPSQNLLNEYACLEDNISYTAPSIEFGTYVSEGVFVPIGPVMSSFSCQRASVVFANNFSNFDMCYILNNFYAKVDGILRTICCASCTPALLPPVMPMTVRYPPLTPPVPPTTPPPPEIPRSPNQPPPFDEQSHTIHLVSTHPINVELVCSNSSDHVELQLYESYVTEFIMNPCDAQNMTSCGVNVGSTCTVVMTHAKDPQYLDSASFYTNFNDENFVCRIQGASVQETCSFTIVETRLSQFLQSPSPPPIRANNQWMYSSVSQCLYLLNTGQVEYFVTRSNGSSSASKLITSADEVDSDILVDSCSVFTNHMTNIHAGQTAITHYTFERGYQYSPITNWTHLFLENSLQFTVYDNGTEVSYPGNDTRAIDFKSFLLKSFEHKTVPIQVYRGQYPSTPPPIPPPLLPARRLAISSNECFTMCKVKRFMGNIVDTMRDSRLNLW